MTLIQYRYSIDVQGIEKNSFLIFFQMTFQKKAISSYQMIFHEDGLHGPRKLSYVSSSGIKILVVCMSPVSSGLMQLGWWDNCYTFYPSDRKQLWQFKKLYSFVNHLGMVRWYLEDWWGIIFLGVLQVCRQRLLVHFPDVQTQIIT